MEKKEFFTIIQKDDKFYVTLGSLMLPKPYANKQEAQKAIRRKDWEVIGLFMEVYNNFLENQKGEKNGQDNENHKELRR